MPESTVTPPTSPKKNRADIVAATLFGLGIAMGIVPIAIASLIAKRNLVMEVLDRMDEFWRGRGWQ